MKYYVSVGRGGMFFRIAMVVTGTIGSLVYWRASRRRCRASDRPVFAAAPCQFDQSTVCILERFGFRIEPPKSQ